MKKINNIVLIISLLGILAVVLMVFGSSLGLWEPIIGFSASRTYNDPIGYALIALGLLTFLLNLFNKQFKSIFKPMIAILLGVAVLGPTINNAMNVSISYPPIHDITTDTKNPPSFIFLTEERIGAKNSLVYGGEEIAQQQLKAFPNIKPIITDLNINDAYEQTLHIAQLMKWEIVAEDANATRFEATDTTPYFNFADDIVVQISAQSDGSRIDLRSVSRVGRGDRGMNAQRISAFIAMFETNVGSNK